MIRCLSERKSYTIEPIGTLTHPYIDGENNLRVSQELEFQCQVPAGTGLVETGIVFKNVDVNGCQVRNSAELMKAYAEQMGMTISGYQHVACALLSHMRWEDLEQAPYDCTTRVRGTATKRVVSA